MREGVTGLFRRALAGTRQKVAEVIDAIGGVESLAFEDVEDLLVAAGFPVEDAERLVAEERDRVVRGREALDHVREKLVSELGALGAAPSFARGSVTAMLIVGVNGAGKTTSCAKLARRLRNEGYGVLLCAADTFRAAGSEQLELWAERLSLPVVAQQRGAHPGAVVFDAVARARAAGFDVVVADTAGRLHSKEPLMEELRKVRRSAEKAGADRVVVALVVDAYLGLNTLRQVEEFRKAADVDGLIVTKLDGSPKAGAAAAAALAHRLPIWFVGVGEGVDDLEPFDARAFVDGLLAVDGHDGEGLR